MTQWPILSILSHAKKKGGPVVNAIGVSLTAVSSS